MNFEDNSNQKIIKGLSFRNILHEGSTEKFPKEVYKDFSFIKKIFWKLKVFLSFFFKRILFLKFIAEFTRYFIIRSRVIVTLLSVLSDLFSSYFDSSKYFFVNNLFWGRGKFLRFTAQFLGVFLLLFTLISYSYKAATLDSAEHNFQNVYAAQQDLLVQGASTDTQIPKDRGRMSSEEYLVKTGDSLGSIAEYYGLELETLLWANDLHKDSVIKPGETLEIPPGNGLNVEVESGDTLEALAKKYESNPQMIIDVNWLDFPFELEVGQELFIPDGKKPEPPKPTTPLYSGFVRQRNSSGASPSLGQADPSVGRFLSWPVAGGGRLVQCYSGWHNGIDIAAEQGTDIVAAAPGVVTFSGCQSGGCPPLGSLYGGWGLAWSVIVDHGNGFSTIYAHLTTLNVSSGQTVSTGQSVGKVGATGTAYGLHVHFMLIRGGGWNWINPAPYMHNSVCGY